MNNRPDDRARLLAETLNGEWSTGPVAAMARRAAAHARQRRAVKRASLVLAVSAAAVAAVFLGQHADRPYPPAASSLARAAAAPAAHPGYEIISDEELLATLRDRPLLVFPQENGGQKIVLLDR